MTSGGNNFDDCPENELTKFQLEGKNVTILHTFAALFQYHLSTPKNGTFGVPGRLGRDTGQWGQDTGRPGKYGTVGNPNCMSCVYNLLVFPMVKGFWKSVRFWQSYCHTVGGPLFWGTAYNDLRSPNEFRN